LTAASEIDGEVVSFGQVCCYAATSAPTKDWNSMSAFVQLGQSDLRPRKGTESLWHFKPNREECPKAVVASPAMPKRMAREVVLQFQVPATGFSLVSEPGNKDLRLDRGTIDFRNLTRNLEVELGNAPVEDILRVGIPHEENVDPHFELLYALMPRDGLGRSHPGPPHVPYRDDAAAVRPLPSGKLRPGGSNCPPVIWP
jgi:hypothetical protein